MPQFRQPCIFLVGQATNTSQPLMNHTRGWRRNQKYWPAPNLSQHTEKPTGQLSSTVTRAATGEKDSLTFHVLKTLWTAGQAGLCLPRVILAASSPGQGLHLFMGEDHSYLDFYQKVHPHSEWVFTPVEAIRAVFQVTFPTQVILICGNWTPTVTLEV